MDTFISIIICTRNRADSLKLTLDSFAVVIVPEGWKAELLVVDNGSRDHTRDVVGAAQLRNILLRYAYEPMPGLCHARNTGLVETCGNIILFTDDDIRVSPNWLEGMCRPIFEGKADAVQGGVKPAPHLERRWLTGMLRVWMAAVEDPVRPPAGLLVGANMAFHRRMIEVTGGFDLRLGPGAAGYYDDTIFGWTLKRAGKRILYRPEILVEHHFDPDRLRLGWFIFIARRMAASRAIVEQSLNPDRTRPSVFELLARLPRFGFRCLTQAFRFAVNRSPDIGFLSHYYRLCLWMALRKKIGSPRRLKRPAAPWPA